MKKKLLKLGSLMAVAVLCISALAGCGAKKGEISAQNDLVKAWFDYISSEEGKEIIRNTGLIIPE